MIPTRSPGWNIKGNIVQRPELFPCLSRCFLERIREPFGKHLRAISRHVTQRHVAGSRRVLCRRTYFFDKFLILITGSLIRLNDVGKTFFDAAEIPDAT